MALPHRTVRLDLVVVLLGSVATLVVGPVAAVANGVFHLFQRLTGPLERAALAVLVAGDYCWPTLWFRWSEGSVRAESPGRFGRR